MHRHYDIAAAEAAIRQTLANAAKHAKESAGPDPENRQLVDAQTDLHEAMLQMCLWDMRRQNNGIGDDIAAQALGYTLGSIIFSVAVSSGDAPATMTGIMQAIAKSIMDKRQGGEIEGATSASIHIRPVQGGRA